MSHFVKKLIWPCLLTIGTLFLPLLFTTDILYWLVTPSLFSMWCFIMYRAHQESLIDEQDKALGNK